MAEPLWTSDEIVAATGGRLQGGAFAATGVSIDTRTPRARRPVRRPGRRARRPRIRRRRPWPRARPARWSRGRSTGPAIVVGDTLKALERLGVAARDRATARPARRGHRLGRQDQRDPGRSRAGLARAGPRPRLGQVLQQPHRRAADPGAHAARHRAGGVRDRHEPCRRDRAAVAHGRSRTRWRSPTSARCTSRTSPTARPAWPAPRPRSSRASTPGGTAVLNADNRWFEFLKAEAPKAPAPRSRTLRLGDGCRRPAARLPARRATARGSRRASTARRYVFTLRQTGAHWGLMSLAVLLMLEALDVAAGRRPGGARRRSSRWKAAARERAVRARRRRVHPDRRELQRQPGLDGRGAAHAWARGRPSGRRIVALTDMLELGADVASATTPASPSRSRRRTSTWCSAPGR